MSEIKTKHFAQFESVDKELWQHILKINKGVYSCRLTFSHILLLLLNVDFQRILWFTKSLWGALNDTLNTVFCTGSSCLYPKKILKLLKQTFTL